MNQSLNHIVIFDGVCNFCNASVWFILKRNKKENIYFTDLQSPIANKLLEEAPENVKSADSIIFYQNQQWYIKSDAAIEISRHLTFPWKTGIIFKVIPKFIRDAVYDLIARNRYSWFGKKSSCKIPTEKEKKRIRQNFLKNDLFQ